MTVVMARISLENTGAITKALKLLGDRTAAKVQTGMNNIAQRIYERSQYYVPVDTGALKESGSFVLTGSGFSASAEVWYDTYYAGFVHEHLLVHHDYPTQALYLAAAVQDVRSEIRNLIAMGLFTRSLTIYNNLGGVETRDI